MKTLSIYRNHKDGGVLVFAVVVMLFLSVFTAGLFKLHETNGVETVYVNQSLQAFWEAEAGLLDAIQRLRFDETFRNSAAGSSATFTVTEANSTNKLYEVVVTDSGGGSAVNNHYEFEVISTGFKGKMTRRIKLTVETRPGFSSPVMAPTNIEISQNTIVGGGPIAVVGPNGNIIIDDKIPSGLGNEDDFDIIILNDGSTVDEKKSGALEGEHYAIADIPVPEIPDMPDFSDYYNKAVLEPVGTVATNLGAVNLALAGGITYYNVPAGVTVSEITGGGTIVNTGPISISPKSSITDVDVVADVKIISFGSVNIGQKNNFVGDTLVYAEDTLYFGDHSIMNQRSVLLADGVGVGGIGITMGGHSQFEGIVFADDGEIDVQQGSNGSETRITGTTISGTGITLGQNSEIFYDESVFNPDFFDLSKFFDDEVVATATNWVEIGSLL